MSIYGRLIKQCTRCALAITPTQRMQALYELRNFLDEVEPMDLFISVDQALARMEHRVPEADKDLLRQRGYQFPEDFDEPTKFLTNG
jgi:hypothetical protein